MKKKKGQCHYANCNKRATYRFISKNKILQPEKYCRNHALLLNRGKAFPECAVISLSNYKLLMSGKGINFDDVLNTKEGKEILKELVNKH